MEFKDTMNFNGLMEKFSNFGLEGNGIQYNATASRTQWLDDGLDIEILELTSATIDSTAWWKMVMTSMGGLEEIPWTRHSKTTTNSVTGVAFKGLELCWIRLELLDASDEYLSLGSLPRVFWSWGRVWVTSIERITCINLNDSAVLDCSPSCRTYWTALCYS